MVDHESSESEPSDNGEKGKEPEPESINVGEGMYQPTFNPLSPHLYELFAVIIHRGGAYGGHYHVLIR